MRRKLLFVAGVALVCLMVGHLALNAAGSGKTVLERSRSNTAVTASLPTQTGTDQSSDEYIRSKAAADRNGEWGIRRKAREMRAVEAGYDINIVSAMSDKELAALVASLPAKSLATKDAAGTPAPEVKQEATPLIQTEGVGESIPAPVQDEAKAYAQAVAEKARVESEERALTTTTAPMEAPVPVESEYADRTEAQDALSEIRFRIEHGMPVTDAEKELVTAEYERENSSRRGDDHLDALGGPDGSRYFWVDNQAPETEPYYWIELKGDPSATTFLGSSFTSHDGAVKRVPLGFNFPFYGQMDDSVTMGIDGYLSLSGTTVSFSNGTLPTTSFAAPTIFAFWDDLHIDYGRGGTVVTGDSVLWYRNYGDSAVFEWDSVGFYTTACRNVTSLKFEVILYSNGTVKVMYNNIVPGTSCPNSATLGIQGATTGTNFLQVCANTATNYPANGRAIKYYQSLYTHDFQPIAPYTPTSGLPSSTYPVTVRVYNNGQTTETASISYQFNGGSVVTETTVSIASRQYVDHTFATQITLPGSNGAYPIIFRTTVANDSGTANDTLNRSVIAFAGDDCATAILLTGNGTATYNNCGGTTNTPGQSCGTSASDMVFKMVVPPGSQGSIWQPSRTFDSRVSLRVQKTDAAACPGDSIIGCVDTGDTNRYVYFNRTATSKTLYFVIGYWTTGVTCGDFQLSWDVNSCPTLPAPTAVAPFIQNFDGSRGAALPDCWVQENNADATFWTSYRTNPRSTPASAAIVGTAAGNNDYLFTPGMTLNGGVQYVLEFYVRSASNTVNDSLLVKAGNSATSAGMTTTLFADTVHRTAYILKAVNFTPATTGTYYFGWQSKTVSSSGRLYIDDVSIYPSGSCSAPTVVVNPGMAETQVTLTANASGGSGGTIEYQWFTGTGCQEANRIPNARSASLIVTATGSYSCRAWIIDSSSCASCDSGYATVVNCADPISSLPVFEGFESTVDSLLPACWLRESADTPSNDGAMWKTYNTTVRTGTRSAYIRYSVSGTFPHDWMFMRGMNLTGGTTYVLDFWYRQYLASTSWDDSLQVQYGTSASIAGMTTVMVPSIYINNVGTWTNVTATMTPATSGTYYVGFHYNGQDDEGGVILDDIWFYPQGFCSSPDSVRVISGSGIGATTLTANIYGGMGGAPQYQWYTGATCQAGNEISGATSSSYFATAAGSYACKAWRGDVSCSGCASGTATLIADTCSAVALPYYMTFPTSAFTTQCWRQESIGGVTPTWGTSTSYYTTSPYSAYISSATPALNDWLYSPPLILTGGTTYRIDYNVRGASTSYREELALKFGQNGPLSGFMTNTIVASDTFRGTTWLPRSVTFTPATSGNYYVGFNAVSAAASGIYLDDVRFYADGSCGAPDSLRANAAGGVGVTTLTSTVYGGFGGPAQYQWYNGTTCEAGSEISGANGATLTTTTAGSYSLKAWKGDVSCAVCDSAFANVIADTCAAVTLPYFMSFPTTAFTSQCWRQESVGNVSPTWGYSSSYYVSSPYAGYISSATPALDDWLFSPPLTMTGGTTYRIDYNVRGGSTSYLEDLQLKFGQGGPSNYFMANTIVASDTFRGTTWLPRSVTFTPGTSGNYYVGFHALSAAASGIYLDDIRFYVDGSCGAPDSVRAYPARGIGVVTLTGKAWGGFPVGSNIQYQWYSGESCSNGQEIAGATDTSYSTTTAGVYSLKAWRQNSSECAVCDSALADVITDPCAPLAVPYYQDFNAVTVPNLPTCWNIQNADNASPTWVTSSSAYNSSPNSAFISWRSPAVNDWLFVPGLTLQSGQTYVLDYYYRANSSSYREDLAVKLATGPNAFFVTQTILPTDTFRTTTWTLKSLTFTVPTTNTYYIGFQATSLNALGIYLDDIRVYLQGSCGAPDSVRVAAVTGVGSALLTANIYGGFGGLPQYQWFRGEDCLWANRITGARSATLYTDTTGTFSCRVWRGADSINCAMCDSGLATVSPPPAGDACSSADTLVMPTPTTPTTVSATTAGFYANCTDVCDGQTSNGPDRFYLIDVGPACTRMTFALTGGDMHLSIYQGLTGCCVDPILCNDNDAQFTPLPTWDVPDQHPGGTNSYIAAALDPGTYYVRVGRFGTASGTYTLNVYNNGPCVTPCNAPVSATAYIDTASVAANRRIWLHFAAADTGTYVVYSSTNRANDGDPRNGDPMFAIETSIVVGTPGTVTWTDPTAPVGYKNYVVLRDCGTVLGRCCYGPSYAPECQNVGEAQCQTLGGVWNRYRTCETNPCPVTQQDPAEDCSNVPDLGGPLPITVTGTTTGHLNDFFMTTWTLPACWQNDTWTSNDATGEDVCWGWVVPATATYTFSMCNTTYDNSLLIFNFTCPVLPQQSDFICGSDDNNTCTSTTRAKVSNLSLTQGQHILIVCDGYSTNDGTFELVISTP